MYYGNRTTCQLTQSTVSFVPLFHLDQIKFDIGITHPLYLCQLALLVLVKLFHRCLSQLQNCSRTSPGSQGFNKNQNQNLCRSQCCFDVKLAYCFSMLLTLRIMLLRCRNILHHMCREFVQQCLRWLNTLLLHEPRLHYTLRWLWLYQDHWPS